MSSVSGSAAGNPSGMTAASRTLGAHEHHWFTEPTEPAKKSFVFWLILAQFIFFVALLGPAIVGIGLKILDLQHIGAVENTGAGLNSAQAILGGVGALFATLANVVFGRVSDRTTSRWGRRRIWIVLGTIIMTIGFVVMATGTSLLIATVGWAIAQLGANMTLAPFVATLADQVPKFQRGKITAALGIAQNAGIVGGVYVAGWFSFNLFIVFVIPSILAIGAMIVFAFVLPDKVLPVKPPRMTFGEIIQTIWVSPVKEPDFALAWWSRFLITFASFGFTAFRFGYLINHLKVPEKEIGLLIANTTLVYTGALIVTAWLAGMLSDRIGKRKVFVWVATALFAVGTFALIFVQDVPSYYILELFLGAAYGIYVGVDLALVIDVLPNPDDSGKDLGVLNIANALPQTLAPTIGGFVLLATGGANGSNYAVWFTVCAIAGLIGALVIFPIKKVR
ncbi:MFS transporter [Microbacterium azadirachtae]|uniref:MFS transporter n=1 Tax=Microbacterium azadirachtae TaxID=582680 RepID=UPI0008843E07|nr:MFS transporter [Microbacterium azadirachtae]UXW86135.1 MFS transporter [Microbacterium azadirachtae]SDL62515.1 Na+/melibiose symporter [Microbacterium azadirachtae]SEF91382.1 Na+/melibiose symporter [Microbacterium azadirachtae]SEF93420.1 Na+/melibiose symporter [Microbacterium azadirachtae]